MNRDSFSSHSHRRFHSRRSYLLALAALQLAPILAPAATTYVTYTGPATGSWSNPANWSTGVVPDNTATDTYDVTINPALATTIDFDLPSATIDSLHFTGLDSTLHIPANHHLTIADRVTVETHTATAAITVDAGSLSIPSHVYYLAISPVIQVTNGGQVSWKLSDYYPSDSTTSQKILSAEGAGSLLDLSAARWLGAGDPTSARMCSVDAGAGAMIDLSNLGGVWGPLHRDDSSLTFSAWANGTIKLDHLTQTYEGVGFEASLATLSLPALTQMERATLTARAGIVDLPVLQTADVRALTIDVGGTINAPLLTKLTHTDIFFGGGTLNTGTITSLDDSNIFVAHAPLSFPGVTSYTSTLATGSKSLFTTSLGGSLSFPALTSIDTSTMQSLPTAAIYTIEAGGAGTLDLSHVTTVIGPGERPAGADDRLRFNAGGDLRLDALATISGNVDFQALASTYPLRLPNLRSISSMTSFHADAHGLIDLPVLQSVPNGARFQADNSGAINLPSFANTIGPPNAPGDQPVQLKATNSGTINLGSFTQMSARLSLEISSGGHITAQDLWLGPDATVSVAERNFLTVSGSFVFAPKSNSQGALDAAIVELTPAPGKTALLEAGVPLGLLSIGTAAQPSTVQLVDLYDSGGATGPQSLILDGPFDSTLLLSPGSVFNLGGIDVYVRSSRQLIHLNPLFGDKNQIPWGQGTLINTPFQPVPGDTAPFDGVVDLTDLNNVLGYFGATSPPYGDTYPFDRHIDLTDLNNVLNHLGSADHAAALALIPEPSLLVPLLMTPLPLLRGRRRRPIA